MGRGKQKSRAGHGHGVQLAQALLHRCARCNDMVLFLQQKGRNSLHPRCRHDSTKRAVCPSWLRGRCELGPKCPLQHQRRAELMPICQHFLAVRAHPWLCSVSLGALLHRRVLAKMDALRNAAHMTACVRGC